MQSKLRRNGLVIMFNLIKLLGPFALVMILAILNGTLGFIASMGVTIFGALGIAKLLGSNVYLSYELIIALVIVFGVLRGILRYLEQYSNHYIAFKLLEILRSKIFSKLRDLAPAKLESKQKGNLIAILTADIETLEVFYAHTISPICIATLVSLTVFLFVGFVSSWLLALVALIGFIIIGILLPIFYSNILKKSGVEYRKNFASFNSYFLDSIKGIKEIIFHNKEKDREDKVNEKSEELLSITKNMKSKNALVVAISELSVAIFIAVSLIVGLVLFYQNQIDLGMMIVGIVTIFGSFGPVLAISNLPGNLTQTFASGDRVLNLLEEKPLVEDIKGQNEFVFNSLKVSNLSFSFEDGDEILKNVNFEVKKGEIVGIIGPSGSGKSTILNLLLRFYKKDSGEILYNDIDIDKIDSSSLKDNVSLVLQSTYLFNESILENLKLAKENASFNEIVNSTRKANIHTFIQGLKNGYKSEIKTMGDNLSSGEKQRLGLARAFLKNTPLILLDEPTSNVDSINEGIILKSVLEAKKDHAIILVSHRESTMAIADRIYRFENKTLKEVK